MTTTKPTWVLYGASGYTGSLIAEKAHERGHRPILAGRSLEKLKPIADRLGLENVAVGIDDAPGLVRAFSRAKVVLNAAGPFVETAKPIADACIVSRSSYLDITGEPDVFRALFARDAEAKAAGITLIPGVGFDVVPSDCLLRYVADAVPDATELELGLWAIENPSAGTAKSMLGILKGGGEVRRDGRIVSWTFGKGLRRIAFSKETRWSVPWPLADLESAYRTTHVPNITTYAAVPRALVPVLFVAKPAMALIPAITRFLLRTNPTKRGLERLLEAAFHGPDEDERARDRSFLWACAKNASGAVKEAWLETCEGYRFTAIAAVRAVEEVLAKNIVGATTPASAFGADFCLSIPETLRRDARE